MSRKLNEICFENLLASWQHTVLLLSLLFLCDQRLVSCSDVVTRVRIASKIASHLAFPPIGSSQNRYTDEIMLISNKHMNICIGNSTKKIWLGFRFCETHVDSSTTVCPSHPLSVRQSCSNETSRAKAPFPPSGRLNDRNEELYENQPSEDQ